MCVLNLKKKKKKKKKKALVEVYGILKKTPKNSFGGSVRYVRP